MACPGRSEAPHGSSALAACLCPEGYTGPDRLTSDGVAVCAACEAGTFKDTHELRVCRVCRGRAVCCGQQRER